MKTQNNYTLSGTTAALESRVKELRQKAGLTQEELARRSGVGLRFVRDVEQGKQTVRLDKVNQLLSLFGCRMDVVKDNETTAQS